MEKTSKMSLATFPNLSLRIQSVPSIWAILILAIALRFIQIGTEGVWLDEMYSIDDAIHLSSDNLDLRPLYYILLRAWMFLGNSDVLLRTLSVLFDIGAIYLAYQLCKFTLGNFASLVTALMMCLSPLMINHAQEIRMYSLISCFTLAGSLAMAYALTQPKFKYFGVWALARLLAVFTSPLMMIMLVPDCVLFYFTYRREFAKLKIFLYWLMFIGAVWSPLILPRFFNAVSGVVEDQSAEFDISLANTVSRLVQFTVFWPLNRGELFSESLINFGFYKLFSVALLVTLGIGTFSTGFDFKSRAKWVIAWAFIPFFIQYVACETVLSGTIWKPRYLLYLAPYIMMLMALGVEQLKNRFSILSITCLLLYLVAVGGGLHFYYSQDYRTSWPKISATIEAMEQPNDLIVNYTWMGNHNLPRYYDGDARLVTIHLPRRQSEAERLKMVQEIASQIPQTERLWLVCQAGCKDKEQEEFNLISQAAISGQPTEIMFRHFSNIVHEDTGWGTIDLHLIGSRG